MATIFCQPQPVMPWLPWNSAVSAVFDIELEVLSELVNNVLEREPIPVELLVDALVGVRFQILLLDLQEEMPEFLRCFVPVRELPVPEDAYDLIDALIDDVLARETHPGNRLGAFPSMFHGVFFVFPDAGIFIFGLRPPTARPDFFAVLAYSRI